MSNGLRHLRLTRGLTHAEVAARMGISRGQLIKLERGERQLTERTIRLAALSLDASVSDVLVGPVTRLKIFP